MEIGKVMSIKTNYKLNYSSTDINETKWNIYIWYAKEIISHSG